MALYADDSVFFASVNPEIEGATEESHVATQLIITDIPVPETSLWEQFDDEQTESSSRFWRASS